MSRSKSKHSNVLSLALTALLPLAASLTACASGANVGGPAPDGGAGTSADPRGGGGSGGSSSKPTSTGGAAGSPTTPTSSEGGTAGTDASPPRGGSGGAGATEEPATGTGGNAPGSTSTPPSGTTTPSATGGSAGTATTPPATGGSAGTATTTPPATGGSGGTATTTPPATVSTGGTTAPPPAATGGSGGTATTPPPGTGGTVTTPPATGGTGGTATTTPPPGGPIKYVFVVAMENESSSSVYGSSDAPYLNGLISKYAHATAFADPLADAIPSEPHYVWMEAGTNAFSDATFTTDDDPSASNSTKSTAHLVTQMGAASPPVSWMGYMEGLNSSTGACPVSSSGLYVAKHDPFVFFQDTAGSPPSKSSATCAAHHQAYTTAAFGQALAQGTVGQYNFIVPNVCNDMHGDSACPSSNVVAAGDAWLSANLPPMIDFVNAHQGVLFIMWDEPEGGSLMPFVAIGPGVKTGYAGQVAYTHSSFTKSIDEIFGLPVLSTVSGANDLADLFQPAMFP
jgi:phosphatidylinositol-3-phosphatase